MVAIVGPIAPYSNVPINAQFYSPSLFQIQNISRGTFTTVTTTQNHNYTVGQLVRITLPSVYGMYQINNLVGYVDSILAANQILLNIDSTNFSPYIAATSKNVPQVTAVGDINNGYVSTSGLNVPDISIPGAFINISPE